MTTIKYFEIICKVYHGTPVQKLRYELNGEIVESNLYTQKEITNIITLWKMGELLGSFGIDTVLADNAGFIFCEE